MPSDEAQTILEWMETAEVKKAEWNSLIEDLEGMISALTDLHSWFEDNPAPNFNFKKFDELKDAADSITGEDPFQLDMDLPSVY